MQSPIPVPIPAAFWPLAGMVVNLVWSALNARTLSSLETSLRKQFMTREECALHHNLCSAQYAEASRRLVALETRK
jgi:hypothetical protein